MDEAPQPQPRKNNYPKRRNRKSLADAGNLTELQEKYINLRVRGLAPLRCVETLDKESDPPIARTRGARSQLALKLEDETKHFQRDWISWENMDDAEFEAFRMRTLERMVLFPRETAAFAASALDKIADIRKSRTFSSQENMVQAIQRDTEELMRLADIRNWLYEKTGQREAQKGPKQVSDNTAETTGLDSQPGFGGEPSTELEHDATLSVLSSFIEQERQLLTQYEETHKRLEEDVKRGKVRTPQPEPPRSSA